MPIAMVTVHWPYQATNKAEQQTYGEAVAAMQQRMAGDTNLTLHLVEPGWERR